MTNNLFKKREYLVQFLKNRFKKISDSLLFKKLKLKISKEISRAREQEHIFLILSAIFLGVLGAYGAIGFRFLIHFTEEMFNYSHPAQIFSLTIPAWFLRMFMPAAGGLLTGILIYKISPEVMGSGIPEVIESVAKKGGIIRPRVLVTKALAAAITIGSGGSAGREGPIVHIGAAIGSSIGQIFKISVKNLRTFVACGTSAGIAATFNAPIAGALFAIEVIIGDMRASSMSPVVISSVVATVISRYFLGDFPAFKVPPFVILNSKELVLYAVVGVLAALIAVSFIKALYYTNSIFLKMNLPLWLKPALGGVSVGLIAIFVPEIMGVGYETINSTLSQHASTATALAAGLFLLMLIPLKLFATSLTLGSGGSGGIFAPSLFMGAVLGGAFGKFVNFLFPLWTAPSSAYALVGMGAVVSATTHAPITAILIIFELTNNYQIIPPLMLACVIGVLLASYIKEDSIYTEKLSQKGINLKKGRDINLLRSIKVSSVMDKKVQLVQSELPVSKLFPLLLNGKSPNAVVVDGDNRYLGTVELSDVRESLPHSDELASFVVALDVADTTTPFVTPDNTLDIVMKLLGRSKRGELPVVLNKDDHTVIGTVTKSSLIDSYNDRLSKEDPAESFKSHANFAMDGEPVEILRGIFISQIETPVHFTGKKLKELNFRKKYNIEIVLVLREINDEGESSEIFPSADTILNKGDKILLMGTLRDIKKLL